VAGLAPLRPLKRGTMTLALDGNHDLHLGSRSSIAIATGADAVAQGILTRLRLFRGESYLNRQEGTPWFEEILSDQPDIRRIEVTLKERILDTPNVESLISFSIDFDSSTRSLTVSFEADTVFGPVSVGTTL